MVTLRSATSLECCEFCPNCTCNLWEINAMTGPEVMRAFQAWRAAILSHCHGCDTGSVLAESHACIASGLIHATPEEIYPLWVSQASRWYVRERLPGTRVWRAEEDGTFTLLDANWQHRQPWDELERLRDAKVLPHMLANEE